MMPERAQPSGNTVMSKARRNDAVPQAVAAIRALRDRLAEEGPRYGAAVLFERDAEAFCQAVRSELRKRRRQKKLNQQELGAAVGLTQSAISRIERSEGDIGLKSIYRYATALGLQPVVTFTPSVDDLLGERGDAGELGEELQQAADDLTGEPVRLMQSLSEKMAKLIASVADAARRTRSS
jgi:transcriptional regulator with XRE-family HTH domain